MHELMLMLHIHMHLRAQRSHNTHSVHYTPVATIHCISWCMPCILPSSDGEGPEKSEGIITECEGTNQTWSMSTTAYKLAHFFSL